MLNLDFERMSWSAIHNRRPCRLKLFVTVGAILAGMVLTGCASSGTPQDGRYQTHGGGRDNFRAEVPTISDAPSDAPSS